MMLRLLSRPVLSALRPSRQLLASRPVLSHFRPFSAEAAAESVPSGGYKATLNPNYGLPKSDAPVPPKRAPATTKYPFMLKRTASDNLPIYLQYKRNGIPVTVVRQFRGNPEALVRHIQSVVGLTTRVTMRTATIEIKGNWSKSLKVYFEALGF